MRIISAGELYYIRSITLRLFLQLSELMNYSPLQFLVSSVLPYLADDSIIHRQGVIEAIVCILLSPPSVSHCSVWCSCL